jgi:uncharacterized membrane protein YphA (DoxX/SURF4 family)
MKPAVFTARILVGILFIFSGLIKANDPLGLSYKMQEFFDLWGMTRFDSWTLILSILMNAFEIVAGVALILGWRIRLFSWLLLLLIIFFTFLTGYAYLSGKFKSCGCFGDCIPITAGVSFIKDLILLVLIIFLFIKQNLIKPLLPRGASIGAMIIFTAFAFGIQWYTLNYLPVADCLAFKIGNNIPEKMKIPAGARPDSFAIRFIYEKGGKEFEFSPSQLPADLGTYTFKSRKDKLIREGNAEPAIHGFALSGVTNQDSTDYVLTRPQAILLFCEDFSVPVKKWQDGFLKVYESAKAKNIPVFLVTGRPDEAVTVFRNSSCTGMPIFKCDITTIRTAARTNPCIYLLKAGTIEGKWSYKKMTSVENAVKKLPVQNSGMEESATPVSVPDTTHHD